LIFPSLSQENSGPSEMTITQPVVQRRPPPPQTSPTEDVSIY